jgi:hypothetical protein
MNLVAVQGLEGNVDPPSGVADSKVREKDRKH